MQIVCQSRKKIFPNFFSCVGRYTLYNRGKERESEMMNVNLNLDRHDLELLSVALRLHVDTMTDLSQSQYLPEQSRNQYASDLNRVPHILDVLTMLQVQTIMHDCVQPVSA